MRYVVPLAVLALLLSIASTALGVTEHCPDGGVKVEVPPGATGHTEDIVIDDVTITVTIDGDTVTFTDENGDPIDVVFCIKSSNEAFDGFAGSSGTTPDGQDISYVTVFALVEDEETPPTETPPTDEETPPAETPPAETPGETPPQPPSGGGTPPDTALGEPVSGLMLVFLAIGLLAAIAAINVWHSGKRQQ